MKNYDIMVEASIGTISTATDTFKEKVQSMTAKEIILAMVESLIPPPLIAIDMNTYGDARKVEIFPGKTFLGVQWKKPKTKTICFGCAATNTICKISGKVFTAKNINCEEDRAKFLDTDVDFLCNFEEAIDSLRRGDINRYNIIAEREEFSQIEDIDIYLPTLHTGYKEEDLTPYKLLAEMQ